jgi:hypothetical protein
MQTLAAPSAALEKQVRELIGGRTCQGSRRLIAIASSALKSRHFLSICSISKIMSFSSSSPTGL